jgi:hypothetical protein
MRIKWGRAIVATLAAEVLGVLALIVLVAIFGPPGFEEATPFAEQLGAYVGPISGFTLCMIGGWWTARAALPADKIANGAAMGMIAAALDIALSFALGGHFVPLLVYSNVGRIVAGTLGGWLATRTA